MPIGVPGVKVLEAVGLESDVGESLGHWVDEHIDAHRLGLVSRSGLVAHVVDVDGDRVHTRGPAAEEVLDLLVVLPAELELDAHAGSTIGSTPDHVKLLVKHHDIVYNIVDDEQGDRIDGRTKQRRPRTQVSESTTLAGLTLEDIGRIVDASPCSVASWQSSEVVPQRLNKQRPIESAYVAEAVTEVLNPEDANIWMFTPSRRSTMRHRLIVPRRRLQVGPWPHRGHG